MQNTLQIIAAERTRKAARNLITLLHATQPDKLDWKPLDLGRSIRELMLECVPVNMKWALTLQNGIYTRPTAEQLRHLEATSDDISVLEQIVRESADELATAILAVADNALDDQITVPFGSYSVAELCVIGYWNMSYHEGQANYIQTLYGDSAFHAHF